MAFCDNNSFLTHTFSECVKNHAGVQKIGTKRALGFSKSLLTATCSPRIAFKLPVYAKQP